ncbi:alpha/beta fold hydrolase [Mucilaginibacter myungsuensis]|uniref:Alpha/beta hydrolase n=1 Tax=Mucilaginibacter myungsuensis TaxID=649104 RepID=A0A929L2F9_9SPHI|nr:alpha/beta fold hydrolase [Mucilaginibacter myungsuensis]MBE9664403.1 alpha/beta hydrolase [Mucilaginibacter myungsuensis]MDN3597114.1 alpha/beta hydrolase [Mucilaginibacter myungsuensis]
MKKLLSLLFFLFIINLAAFAQTEPTKYKATVEKYKLYHNTNKPDSLYKLFGGQMAVALTLEQTRQQFGGLRTQLGNLVSTEFINYANSVASYEATYEKGQLAMYMELDEAGKIVGLRLAPSTRKPVQAPVTPTVTDPDMNETPVSVKVSAGNISGTLGMPKTIQGKVPVVLIIAGSGPTDRNGNNPAGVSANSYKMLASALAKNGIASLRYDKRMIGQSVSATKEKDMRFEDYSDDAREIIKTLTSDARFSKVIVLGHSEGSLLGMIAVQEQPVKAFISIAGAGDRIDKTLIDQLKGQSQLVRDGAKTIIDSLLKGKTVDKIDPQLYSLFRPSVQPYMISWMAHDPIREIKKLKMPVLIVQGTTDIQVGTADAEKLKKAKSDAQLLIIAGMNHVLKDAPAKRGANFATYANPDLPIKPELVNGIVTFINKLK